MSHLKKRKKKYNISYRKILLCSGRSSPVVGKQFMFQYLKPFKCVLLPKSGPREMGKVDKRDTRRLESQRASPWEDNQLLKVYLACRRKGGQMQNSWERHLLRNPVYWHKTDAKMIKNILHMTISIPPCLMTLHHSTLRTAQLSFLFWWSQMTGKS